ncbi:MAG: membrane metalloprotease [Flavobacteriaceae bacterium]|nr:membrane metalloprotease [Flavobacteriaceae bacterium]
MSSFSYKILLLFFVLMTISSCKKDDDQDVTVDDPKAENRKELGASSEDILSNDFYKSLTVELVYSEIYKPTQESIDNLRTFITDRVNKPSGINFVERQIAEQPNDPFTIQEIRDIEDRVRTKYTEGDDLAIYVFFSNGSSTNDTQTTVTLGTAYRNTSIVIYERTLQVITEDDPTVLPLLESASLNHEFGHILGLTNILNDDIHDEHEDLAHAKHCFVEDCLMYFDATNVTRSSMTKIINNLTRRMEVPALDPLCIADLQAKGGK